MGRASEFKSEDPGFDPLAEQGEGQVFFYPPESTLVQTCLCLTLCVCVGGWVCVCGWV